MYGKLEIGVVNKGNNEMSAIIEFMRRYDVEINYADAVIAHTRLVGVAGSVNHAGLNGAIPDIDAPRNIAIMDGGVGAGNSGDVVIDGMNQYWERVQETIPINTLGRQDGSIAFAYIISVTFPAITDTSIDVVWGSKMGILANLKNADSLKYCGVDVGGAGAKFIVRAAAFTVNATYDTIEVTGVPLVAGDIYEFYLEG